MLLRTLGLAWVAASFLSCATSAPIAPASLDYFAAAPDDNPWNRKIQNWQLRHQEDPAPRAPKPTGPSELGHAYSEFVERVRHEVVAEAVSWVQEMSREHYRPDGDHDHWATLGEVMESGGDDCDGLDLLTFVLLRRLGFAKEEIFRAIVVERGSGQHHMVTLWFDRPDRRDPLILDPTGVVTATPARLSEVPAWNPIELFDEGEHFAVAPERTSEVAAPSR
jgi:predicted transglutaminase-like cysteine proteinase